VFLAIFYSQPSPVRFYLAKVSTNPELKEFPPPQHPRAATDLGGRKQSAGTSAAALASKLRPLQIPTNKIPTNPQSGNRLIVMAAMMAAITVILEADFDSDDEKKKNHKFRFFYIQVYVSGKSFDKEHDGISKKGRTACLVFCDLLCVYISLSASLEFLVALGSRLQ